MATEIKIGAVVQLRSGGPLMTVEGLSTNPEGETFARCSWFVKDEVKKEAFKTATLDVAEDD